MAIVAMTLANYCDVHKRLPPAVLTNENGQSYASWRMAVLWASPAGPWGPEDHGIMGKELDLSRPWDDPVNRPVTSQAMPFYCFANGADGALDTNVFAVTGPRTAFESDSELTQLPHDTIVLVEVSDSGVPWAAPGDLDASKLTKPMTLFKPDDGFHVVFADQTVWRLRSDVPVETLREFCCIEEARRFDREQELGGYRLD